MKIVEPKYEILTDISEGGIKELQQIERVARGLLQERGQDHAGWRVGKETGGLSGEAGA